MFKKIISLCLIFTCTIIFANDDTVVIKAKGELAEELKALLEKYDNKDGNLEIIDEKAIQNQNSPIEQALQEQIKIDSQNPAQQSKQDIYRQFFSDDPYVKKEIGNVLEGKAIYDKTCFKCHGEKAEKSTYNTARTLTKLSREDIIDQLRSYNRDSGYGSGSNGMIMRSQATMLNTAQINSLAAYIESLKEKSENNSTN